ncbi:MAG: SO_0444 family Cu/Zn efflux transporter [bacterium]|nr:SO_0444 family Cu/Zn efflux transporter [bacterium]
MLVDSAFFFLLGLVLAGVVWLVLNETNARRLVGDKRHQSVFRAAIIGVPLPLCSCSVLPVASQLRGSGISRGGTVSFLIATPESSIDSILLTYSLTDPLLTVARPITAFLTAVVAGLTESSFEGRAEESPVPLAAADCDDCCCETSPKTKTSGLIGRLGEGLRHSFTTLIADLAPYLLMGYLLAGLVGALLGPDMTQLPAFLTSGWAAYIGATLVGVPLYVCATSSTPLAAVLLASGFPPGAILVFLMVGPATNIAALTVLKKILGFGSTVRYLVSIVLVSVVCGLLLDWLYDIAGVAPDYLLGAHASEAGWFHISCAVILSALIVWHTLKARFKAFA